MASRRALLLASPALALPSLGLPALASCTTRHPSAGSKPPRKVTYLTGVGTRPREEYVQVALAKGYFRDAGLQVTVRTGSPGDANLKVIAAGKAQFATVDFVSAVRAVSTYPDTYLMVAPIQRRTLIAFLALPDKHIQRAEDLAGKTVGIPPGSSAQNLLPVLGKLANFDSAKVKVVNVEPDRLPTLLVAGQIDAMSAYSIDTPTVKAADPKHQNPTVVRLSDHLSSLYGTVLVANKDLCTFFPAIVRGFATGLIRGVHDAVEHPAEAARIIKQAVPTTDLDAAVETMRLMQRDVATGLFDHAQVMQGIAVLESVGLAPIGPASVTPEQLIALHATPAVAQ
jgi:NitT/TauT family transport system substrate-binding protein